MNSWWVLAHLKSSSVSTFGKGVVVGSMYNLNWPFTRYLNYFIFFFCTGISLIWPWVAVRHKKVLNISARSSFDMSLQLSKSSIYTLVVNVWSWFALVNTQAFIANITVYGGADTTTSGTPTSGAGGLCGPCGAGGKFAIANVITITIWRELRYLFFLLKSPDGVFLFLRSLDGFFLSFSIALWHLSEGSVVSVLP